MSIQTVMWFREDENRKVHAFAVNEVGTVAVVSICGDKTDDDCDEHVTKLHNEKCCESCLQDCILLPWVKDLPEVRAQFDGLSVTKLDDGRAELKKLFEDVQKKTPYIAAVALGERMPSSKRSHKKAVTLESIKRDIDAKIRSLQAGKTAVKTTVQTDKQCTVCKNVVFAGSVAMVDPTSLEVRSCKRCNLLLQPSRPVTCPECGRSVEVRGDEFPYHDIAPMLRQVCRGSKKPVKS